MLFFLLLLASLANATMILVDEMIDVPPRVHEFRVNDSYVIPLRAQIDEWVDIPFDWVVPSLRGPSYDWMEIPYEVPSFNDVALHTVVKEFQHREWFASSPFCREDVRLRNGLNYTLSDCIKAYCQYIIECTPSRGHFMTSREEGDWVDSHL